MLKPASEKPSSKGQAWFCTTGLPSDVIIEVADMTFHLHKFPLMSKSRKLHDLITEEEKIITKFENPDESNKKIDSDNQEEEDIEEDEDECHITLQDFPGGSESFESAAKFCYGVKIDLSAANAASLRCAAEYLQMTEEFSAVNFISRTEIFLSQSVFKNIKHSVKTLSSCEKLLPMAEDLGIVWGCIESIATTAAAVDPSLFGWPVNDEAVSNKAAHEARGSAKFSQGGGESGDSWLDELWLLSLPILKRLIFAMKSLNLSSEIIESCLISYAKKYIPGISRTTKKPSSSSRVPTENEQRDLLEAIVSLLPVDKTSHSNLSSKTTRFLFRLLRTAYILNASGICRSTLEKKIGSQLEHATLDDLLIPSYSYLNETLYDVDCVEKILRYFLQGIAERPVNRLGGEDESGNLRSAALILVGKFLDGYLSEVASDSNLKPDKFYDLAVALPDRARIFDDGLYRAVDVYLKAHPWLSEAEREKICGVLNCQKLTLEACTHAAQNERLPLRAVVQVLFFEQLQLRHAISGTNCIAADAGTSVEVSQQFIESGGRLKDDSAATTPEERRTWRAAVKENQVLRVRMDSMRTRVHQLEREYCTMKETIEKIEKVGPRRHVERRSWLSKFGCKFKTQVCDSHERTAAEARKGRSHPRPP